MAARYIHNGLGQRLTVAFGGDINLGGLTDQFLPQSLPDKHSEAAAARLRQQHPLLGRRMRTAEVWGNAVGTLQANLSVVSLSSPLTASPHRARSAGGGLIMDARRAHPLNLEVLADANVDCVTLATGHAMDYGEEGMLDTFGALEAASIVHAGAGRNQRAALRPALMKSRGRTVAVFSVSEVGCGLNDVAGRDMWAADERRSGIAHVRLGDETSRLASLLELRDAAS